MADTLESLEVKVLHSSTGAANSIYEVTESIRQMGKVLSEVLPQVRSFASSMKSISKIKSSDWGEKQQAKLETPDVSGMQSLRDSLDMFDVDTVSETLLNLYGDIENVVHVFGDLGKSAVQGIGVIGKVLSPVVSAIKTATMAVAKFASSLGKLAVKGVQSTIKGITGAVDGLKNRVKKSIPAVTNFLSSLKRIAGYRILRTIIKEITQAFKEGLENAYAFSQGIVGESHRFAEVMDSMSTSGLTMKNQLGSAFIALLTAIAPIINAIISLVTKLANAIAQLISAFTGSTYLKAADVPKKWADAAGGAGKAAKEWKNQLMGFDEINRLEEPSDGSGGGGSTDLDPSSMFEDAPIAESIKEFVDNFKAAILAGDWQGAGQLLGNKINELLPTPEQWKAWGGKLGYGLDGAIQTLYSTLKTINFGAIGEGIANFLNGALEAIHFEYLGAVLVRKITAALDFLVGFLGSLNWARVGESIFEFLMGALREANEWLESKNWDEVGKKLFQGFKDLISKIDFAELAKAFFTFLGLAFGAILQLLDEFFLTAINGIADYFKGKFEECGGNVIEGLFKGIKDAAVGIYNWAKENIVDPFVGAVKSLLGIHSPSIVFAGIGSNMVEGLKSGFSGAWSGFESTVSRLFGSLISWCQQAHGWIQDVLDGLSLVASANTSRSMADGSIYLQGFASGGYPTDGQLFIANEGNAGAELVGNIGGRTAVASNSDILEGIRQGVFEAVSAAMNGGQRDVDVRVYLDSREIKTGQQRLNRSLGVA